MRQLDELFPLVCRKLNTFNVLRTAFTLNTHLVELFSLKLFKANEESHLAGSGKIKQRGFSKQTKKFVNILIFQ